MAIIVILVIVVLIILWVIGVQRQLVSLDEMVNNALNQINVQLTSRFDALSELLNLVKGYNEHEYNTLTDIIKMRTSGNSVKAIEDNQNILDQVASKIVAVAESYPDLKSNTNYQNLMNSLNDYESKVRQSRLVYNDTVTKLNRYVRMFPQSMIAGIFGITGREYLKVDENKTQMPSMK